MHRFYLPSATSEAPLALLDREAHHAANVLRVRRGETVTVLNGVGEEFVCCIENVSKRQVDLQIQETRYHPPLPYKITLVQAVPKGKLIESIIQKATELGVGCIVPLLTERVITQVGDDQAEVKREKWQQVAIEAVKQCGQTWLPKVETPIALADFLRKGDRFDMPLVASLQPGSKHPREFFSRFRETHHRLPRSVSIWVGPEGDFSQREVDSIVASGTLPITLGPLVLRCETAATYCLSVINYELQSTL